MNFVVKNIQKRTFSTANVLKSTTVADVVQGPALLRTSGCRPQPSLMFLPGLRSLPFWTQVMNGETRVAYQDETVQHVVNVLESNWKIIRDEYQRASLPPSDYVTTTEHTKLHKGTWHWHSYMSKGKLLESFGKNFPETDKILTSLQPLLFTGTPFGYAFFSKLHPDSTIQPHTAPSNLRLRIHLGLDIPKTDCGIRVGTVTRTWEASKALVLDDSFNHETWNRGDTPRIILLVDIWHPDINPTERNEIINMFKAAQAQGWLS
jgi:aspartate beta-hydroxylase